MMELDPALQTTLIAGVISVVVGIISYLSTRASVRHEVHQSQFKDILMKRIELYPKLWRIHILYETNWVLEKKPKTREWAEQYVAALNEFNLEGGLFFSQGLYEKFFELRSLLYAAIETTKPNEVVDQGQASQIRNVVYGVPAEGIPGLSTYEKDDLGSYRSTTLQRRMNT